MVLLERAQELEISVSDDELQKAVSEIKSDYPEGEFEQTLIESAVSYDSWRDQLKTRLTIEKVIDAELKNRITISAEDIAQHYKKNYQDREIEPDSAQSSQDINEAIVMQLRREKAEQAYNPWIEELKAKYVIEINSKQWDKIAGPEIIEANETDAGNPKSE
jgi:FKBP-type peptidyl-prolyl cis-trans isomerase (trigger factor)